jgi:hypothetical protein
MKAHAHPESVIDAAVRVVTLAEEGKITASPTSTEGGRALILLEIALDRSGHRVFEPRSSELAMAAVAAMRCDDCGRVDGTHNPDIEH